MAAAQLSLEVTCSICTEIFTDPITLICGHSFCQVCISRTFDSQQYRQDREYFCPECMERFTRRPELKKNPRLANIADHFHSTEPKRDSTGNVCSYCVDSPASAVTLCLHCEAFLCEMHKQTHKKSPEHVFTNPTASMEDRKCSVHKKILEYYCTVDRTFICAHCLTSDHNGHNVSTISQLLQTKTKNLKQILEKLFSQEEETEAMILSLQEHKRTVQESAAAVHKRVCDLMSDIRRQQEDLQKKALSEISRQERQISLSTSSRIQDLEKKKFELRKKIKSIEMLSKKTNPLSSLQTSEDLLCVSEDEYDMDRGMSTMTSNDACDLEKDLILEKFYSGLSDILMGAGIRIQAQEIPNASPSAASNNVHLNVTNESETKAKIRKSRKYHSYTSSQTVFYHLSHLK